MKKILSVLLASLLLLSTSATLFTEDFYKPMFKNKSEATYVMVVRIFPCCSITAFLMGLLND